MKFVFTGAGGGHFYPLIAVAESLQAEILLRGIGNTEGDAVDFYFISDKEYDAEALQSVGMKFVQIPAGKLRLYASLDNIIDIFKTMAGIIVSFIKLYIIYPDVIFAKGGYASFPVLFAARFLSIPVIIHESDAIAGRTTSWAGSFAEKIAISQESAADSFDKKKVALTGQPVRQSLLPQEGYRKNPNLPERPRLLILGGSQGSSTLNDTVLSVLSELLNTYDIVHQTGDVHESAFKILAERELANHKFKDRYFASGFVNLSLYYPKTDIVLSRAGSTTLFEVALWQIPSIVVPIPQTVSRDQTKNAYAFEAKGTCVVIEESNFTKSVFLSTVHTIATDKERYERMSLSGLAYNPSREASYSIAAEMLKIASAHAV